MKQFVFIVLFLVLSSCTSKRGVNDTAMYVPVMVPAAPNSYSSQTPNQAFTETLQKAPLAAISGTLYLNGDLPTPLPRVKLALYKKEAGAWKELGNIHSEAGGVFSFTRSLPPGEYSVRISDHRYVGVLPVILEAAPKQDLVLLAELPNK